MAGRDEVRLRISREAARLFLAHGVAETSGDAIAAAAGVSTRTVWRHFRNKESCVGPVLVRTIQRFAGILNDWPLDTSLEAHLRVRFPLKDEDQQLIGDGALAVRLVALCAREPDIRAVWLDAYHFLELQLHEIVARRANRSSLDFDVRLCAAAIVAAVRVVDEVVGVAVMNGDRASLPEDLVDLISGAIRTASTLPICDPIAGGVYNLSAGRVARAARD